MLLWGRLEFILCGKVGFDIEEMGGVCCCCCCGCEFLVLVVLVGIGVWRDFDNGGLEGGVLLLEWLLLEFFFFYIWGDVFVDFYVFLEGIRVCVIFVIVFNFVVVRFVICVYVIVFFLVWVVCKLMIIFIKFIFEWFFIYKIKMMKKLW